MEAMTKFPFLIIFIVLCLINDGKFEKSLQSIESKTNFFWHDNIDSSHIRRHVNLKSENEVENFSEDEKLLKKMFTDTSISIDNEKLGAIGDRIIAQADVSEETKRVVRQVKKQRPGIFWTLFRVLFETLNETRSVIQQINDIVSQNIIEGTTLKPSSTSTTPSTDVEKDDLSNESTTQQPFKLSRQFLQDFTRRNIRGLVRLFNVEWKDAINESQNSIKQFQKDLAKSVEPFLADNPDAY